MNYLIELPDIFDFPVDGNRLLFKVNQLRRVDELYKQNALKDCEVAVTQSYRIKDWNLFLAGEPVSEIIKDI